MVIDASACPSNSLIANHRVSTSERLFSMSAAPAAAAAAVSAGLFSPKLTSLSQLNAAYAAGLKGITFWQL